MFSIDYLLSSNISKPKHQYTYYIGPLNFVSLEDIVKKHNHNDFLIMFTRALLS